METLLLHGALGAKEQLAGLRDLLTARGRKVHVMNFSGHGGEPFSHSGFGIEVFAEDVRNFLNANDLPRVDIFGYSMGGYVALWFVHENPQRVGSIVTLGTKFDWDEASAAKEIAKLNPAKIIEKVPAFVRLLEHRHAPNDWKQLLNRTSDMMRRLGAQPLLTEDVLKEIQVPVEVVLGDLDDMADRSFSEKMASVLPNGQFRLLENTVHAIEKLKWVPFSQ